MSLRARLHNAVKKLERLQSHIGTPVQGLRPSTEPLLALLDVRVDSLAPRTLTDLLLRNLERPLLIPPTVRICYREWSLSGLQAL